jgi:hypothetical protein
MNSMNISCVMRELSEITPVSMSEHSCSMLHVFGDTFVVQT